MTKEQAAVDTRDLDYQIGAMQAFKARRQIECRFRDTGGDVWKLVVDPKWNWDLVEYRIKPTAKLRAWTADEVPLGAWIKSKHDHWKSLILEVDKLGKICVYGGTIFREAALENHEHSLDGGKTWHPCGVMEETK
jgi:hypothetical protein